MKITRKTAPASANVNPPEPCKKTEKEKRNTKKKEKKKKRKKGKLASESLGADISPFKELKEKKLRKEKKCTFFCSLSHDYKEQKCL